MKKTLGAIPGLVVGVFLFGAAEPARASAILTLTQVGSDVLLSGSGSINLSALSFVFSTTAQAFVEPNFPAIAGGPTGGDPVDVYTGFSGPSSFGPGPFSTVVTSGSGDRFGFQGAALVVPRLYTSNSPLTATSTFAGATFASLGVIPGTYVYSWGSAANATADTLTVQIGPAQTAVPEPASLTLLGLGLTGLAARRWRHRREH